MKNETEKLSAEDVRKILHISKRKCAWMLQNGIIPCQDTGKKTHRYIILRKDLVAYINDCKHHPQKPTFPVSFSSNKQNIKLSDKYFLHFNQVPTSFASWLDNAWIDLPDMFSIKDIELLIGYHHESILRWISRGWLKVIRTHNVVLIPKQWLIEFVEDYGFRIAKKSEEHRKLLDQYFK